MAIKKAVMPECEARTYPVSFDFSQLRRTLVPQSASGHSMLEDWIFCLLPPTFPIKATILDGLGHMFREDVLFTIKISDSPRYFEDTIKSSR